MMRNERMKRALCLLLCAALLGAPAAFAETVDISTLTKAKDVNEAWDDTAVAVVMSGDSATVDGAGAAWDAQAKTLTFSAEGDYLLTGELNGSLVVDASKTQDVRLILNGITVSSPAGPALYVKSADKVVLTLAEGTQNAFSDAAELTDGEDTIAACVYSKDDLSINGAGALAVSGNVKNGLVCKNDLLLVNGSVTVTAQNDGVRGKDSVTLLGGSLAVTSGGDGVVSDETDDDTKGYALIAGGTLSLVTGGGAGNAEARVENWGRQSAQTADDGVSMKGVKATNSVTVQGGTIVADCADDALHADNIAISGGQMTLATGDDGMHADSDLTISGGQVAVTQSYEGLEGTTITISGGDVSVVSSDDGLNAAGGNDSSAMAGFGGFDRFNADTGAMITLSGGVLHVNAEGDGIDSNGSIAISGGETYVDGPTNSGNGALDYAGECTLTGGTLVAAGAAGMAQNVGEASTQAALMVTGSGGEIVLKDESGNVLLSYTPAKSYGCAVLSCPGMAVGSAYTVTCGGAQVYGGTLEQTVTGGGMNGFDGGFGGHGGRGGKPGAGGMPNDRTLPADEPTDGTTSATTEQQGI